MRWKALCQLKSDLPDVNRTRICRNVALCHWKVCGTAVALLLLNIEVTKSRGRDLKPALAVAVPVGGQVQLAADIERRRTGLGQNRTLNVAGAGQHRNRVCLATRSGYVRRRRGGDRERVAEAGFRILWG
jgi:hypothetical protein